MWEVRCSPIQVSEQANVSGRSLTGLPWNVFSLKAYSAGLARWRIAQGQFAGEQPLILNKCFRQQNREYLSSRQH